MRQGLGEQTHARLDAMKLLHLSFLLESNKATGGEQGWKVTKMSFSSVTSLCQGTCVTTMLLLPYGLSYCHHEPSYICFPSASPRYLLQQPAVLPGLCDIPQA